MYVHTFGGFILVSHGHSNTGDCFVAVMIVLFLLWRPRQVVFILLGTTEEKNPLNISVLKGSVLSLDCFVLRGNSVHHNYIFYLKAVPETQAGLKLVSVVLRGESQPVMARLMNSSLTVLLSRLVSSK